MNSKKHGIIIRCVLLLSMTAGFFANSFSETLGGGTEMGQNTEEIMVPKSFVNLLYRDCGYLYLAELDSQTGYVMKFEKEPYEFEIVKEFEIASGKQKGAKKSEWDLRTPVGLYEITEFKPGHTLHEKFGPGAYVLNYPNPLEKAKKRTGSGIWIHGTDRIDFIDFDSEGCIRMKNSEFPLLAEYLKPELTPVIIVDKIKWIKLDQLMKLKKAFDERINNYNLALKDDQTQEIVHFYHSSFYAPELNMDYIRWIKHLENKHDKNDLYLHKVEEMSIIFRENTIMTIMQKNDHQKEQKYIIWKNIEDHWLITQKGTI